MAQRRRRRRRRIRLPTSFILVCMVALVLPFQKFLAAKKYTSAEAFFSDILPWAVGAAAIIVPFAAFLFFRRLKQDKLEAPEIRDIPPPRPPAGGPRRKRLAK